MATGIGRERTQNLTLARGERGATPQQRARTITGKFPGNKFAFQRF